MGSFKEVITFSPIDVRKEKPKAATKRTRQSAILKTKESAELAVKEREGIAETSEETKRKRRSDVQRTKTIVSDPLGLGGKADTVRKILTGE